MCVCVCVKLISVFHMYYNIFSTFSITKMKFTATASSNSFNYAKLLQEKLHSQ